MYGVVGLCVCVCDNCLHLPYSEEAVSRARGVQRYKHVAILDMQGLSLKHLGKEFFQPMKTIM
jgi:hypothetical protein